MDDACAWGLQGCVDSDNATPCEETCRAQWHTFYWVLLLGQRRELPHMRLHRLARSALRMGAGLKNLTISIPTCKESPFLLTHWRHFLATLRTTRSGFKDCAKTRTGKDCLMVPRRSSPDATLRGLSRRSERW